jgi:hypothetical protein
VIDIDQVTGAVQMLVILARLFAAALGRNDDAFACILQGIDDALLRIVSFVGDDGGGRRAGQ